MRRFSLLLPLALLACGDDSTATTSTGSTSGTTGSGMGGGGVTASSSTGLSSTTSSSSSGTGTGGAPPVAGAPGSETVSAGDVCTSPNYKMIMTFGQPTQNQGPMSSPNFKVNGGLIGATN
jgi:hypothetical protein